MNKKVICAAVLLVIIIGIASYLLLKTSGEQAETFLNNSSAKNAGGAQIANPASVYCERNNGTLEIRTGSDSSQAGYCVFPDGKECEEWAFYRGECKNE